MNLCAFDIGTVTARMLACTYENGELTTRARRTTIVNLGEGVDATGMLKTDAMLRVRDTLAGYLDEVRALWPEEDFRLRAVATSASRDAKNTQELIDMLAEIGISLEVIPGEEEAALSFAGASAAFAEREVLVCDVGGGSTELISGIGAQSPDAAHSFDIGCRRVTERFLKSDPPSAEELSAARAWISAELERFLGLYETDNTERPLIAVAGTATSVTSVHMQMETYDSERVHLSHITPEILDEVCERLAHMTLSERKQVVGLQPERASVIVAGLVILQEVVRATKSFGFIVSESDILLGIISTLL